jgi:hypothetical protein
MIHAFLNQGSDMRSAGLANQIMATAAQIMAIPIVVFMAVPSSAVGNVLFKPVP